MGNTCPSPVGLPVVPIACGDTVTVTVSNFLPDKVRPKRRATWFLRRLAPYLPSFFYSIAYVWIQVFSFEPGQGDRIRYTFSTCDLTGSDTSISLWDNDFQLLSCIDDSCGPQTQLDFFPGHGATFVEGPYYLVPNTFFGFDATYDITVSCETLTGTDLAEQTQPRPLSTRCVDFCKTAYPDDQGECMKFCPVCCNPSGGQVGTTKTYDTEDGSTNSVEVCLCKLSYPDLSVGECLAGDMIPDGASINCNIWVTSSPCFICASGIEINESNIWWMNALSLIEKTKQRKETKRNCCGCVPITITKLSSISFTDSRVSPIHFVGSYVSPFHLIQ